MLIVALLSVLGFILGGIIGAVCGAAGAAKVLVEFDGSRETRLDRKRAQALKVMRRLCDDAAIQDVTGSEKRVTLTTDDLQALVDPLLD